MWARHGKGKREREMRYGNKEETEGKKATREEIKKIGSGCGKRKGRVGWVREEGEGVERKLGEEE